MVSLALAGLILAAFVSLRDGCALLKHYKKLANLDSFMDKMRYASCSGMPMVALGLSFRGLLAGIGEPKL
jgi:hypothetical protein